MDSDSSLLLLTQTSRQLECLCARPYNTTHSSRFANCQMCQACSRTDSRDARLRPAHQQPKPHRLSYTHNLPCSTLLRTRTAVTQSDEPHDDDSLEPPTVVGPPKSKIRSHVLSCLVRNIVRGACLVAGGNGERGVQGGLEVPHHVMLQCCSVPASPDLEPPPHKPEVTRTLLLGLRMLLRLNHSRAVDHWDWDMRWQLDVVITLN
jgi:hypothetical protein